MEEQQTAPTLTLDDIKLAVNVIDVVTSRGAIRGDEMASVGILRNKMILFLDSVGALKTPELEPETDEEDE